jgi:L-cysteine/cystine lyase
MDASRFRAEFPVVESTTYLDAATAGPVPRCGAGAMGKAITEAMDRGRGDAAHWARLARALSALKDAVARMLKCTAADIAVVRSARHGTSRLLAAIDLGPGDEILVSDCEDASLVELLQARAATRRFTCRSVRFGEIADEINAKTKLVVCSHVSPLDGRIADVEAIRSTGARLLLDGSQALGAIPVDVATVGCDAYLASGDKWTCGPPGIAYLYVTSELARELDIISPMQMYRMHAGHGSEADEPVMAARLEDSLPGAPEVAWALSAMGLEAEAGLDWMAERAASGAAALAECLSERGVEVLPRGPSTIVSWRSPDTDATLGRFSAKGILVTGLPADGALRAAVGAWSCKEDLERLIDAAA